MSRTEPIDETDGELAVPDTPRPRGALALVGQCDDLDEVALNEVVTHIYAERARDIGRPVDLGK